MIQNIKLFFRFLRSKNRDDLLFKDVSAKSLEQYEIDCLALGLWEMFKAVNIPKFVIGMDDNADCLLTQYVIEKYPSLNMVAQTKQKISIAKELIDRGKNIYVFFDKEGFYSRPEKTNPQ